MKSVELIYSKTKIDKAGEILKSKTVSSHEKLQALDVLSNWRAIHAVPLDSFARILKTRAQKIHSHTIVAQRLKRTPSILIKLSNHKTMRLSAMQDIGGLRAVLENNDDVYKLLELYKKSKSKHSGHYSLMLLNSRENTISLQTFGANQFEAAAKSYLDLERMHFNDKQINIVLVNTGDIKKLEESYPNYFMDTKILVRDLSLIMLGKFI